MRAQVPSEIPPTSQNHKDIVSVYSVEFQNTRRVPPQKLESQKPFCSDVGIITESLVLMCKAGGEGPATEKKKSLLGRMETETSLFMTTQHFLQQ